MQIIASFKYHVFFIGLLLLIPTISGAQTIVKTSNASISEEQAAKEIRRYIFLRTGTAPSIVTANTYTSFPSGDVIVVAENNSSIITELKPDYGSVDAPSSDDRIGYLIKSISKDSRNVLVICGADSITTLRAAYRFAELIGCHFNLDGDVVPDDKLAYPIDISAFDEKGLPWFEIRGILPFHNFLAGPDFWSTEDYKSVITQLSKMGMNFFGLHLYTEKGDPNSLDGPEPHLWIGHKDDVNLDGTIKEEGAYEAHWASTYRTKENSWSGTPIKTTGFSNGADKLFAYDEMASDAMGFTHPTTQSEKAEVINNVGFLLQKSFTHARQMGVKTAIGHEAPLGFEPGYRKHLITKDWIRGVPEEVQYRMRWHGINIPEDTKITNEIFNKTLLEGMFTRIARTHPLDYYWLWTYETWSYNGHQLSKKQIENVASNYKYCNEVLQETNAPFKLATFGWKVGSAGGDGDALEFHDDLPLEVPFGGLWDNAGSMWAVLPTGRPGWSSCWYEEDWGLIQPQLRVMGIFNEVGHSLNNGGVQAHIAKHWRLNSVAPNSAAHAALIWENRGPIVDDLSTVDQGHNNYPMFDIWETSFNQQPEDFVNWITAFYRNWAEANFGSERATEIGDLFAKADRLGEPKFTGEGIQGSIPRSSRFLPSALNELEDNDPTSITDPTFLDAIHFYTEFCSYKDDIVGTGNKDRYMYWYHFFQGQIDLLKLATHRELYVNEINQAENADSIINTFSRLMTHEIQRVRSVSELGVIAQLQQSTLIDRIRASEEMGISIPISTAYEGEPHVRAMPEVSQIYQNGSFDQKVIFIGNGTVSNTKMHYREIGSTLGFSDLVLSSVNSSGNVFKANIVDPGFDFEYYIEGTIDGDTVTYPVTGGNGANNINKTVIRVIEVPFVPTELEEVKIPKSKDKIELLVYPNPTSDYFNVALTREINEIQIYNTSGQLILQVNDTNGPISITDFSQGIYIIRVVTNEIIGYSKIIKL